MPDPNNYLLGTSHLEIARLRKQAAIFASETATLLDRIGVQHHWHAIDVGCGPIGILNLLCDRIGISGSVVGVDANAEMLDVAKTITSESGNNIRLIHADARATGLPRDSFDLVHERLVLINVPDPERVVEEMVGLASRRGCGSTRC